MKVADRVYLVGSGALGSGLTNDYDCNVYLLDGGESLLLLDSGGGIDVPAILGNIEKCGFHPQQIEAILLTHAHADHSGGACDLKQITGAKVVASAGTARIMRERDAEAIGLPAAMEQGLYPANYKWRGCSEVEEIADGGILRVGDLTLEAIAAPGHATDMFCFYCIELQGMFSGDVVFAGGRIAAIQSPDFSMEQLARSTKKLANWPIDNLFPGHLEAVISNGSQPVHQAALLFEQGLVPQSIV